MKTASAIACLIFLSLVASLASAKNLQKENPRQTLIKAAKFLEEKPLDKDAKKVRAQSLSWIIETNQLTVKMCPTLLGTDKKYKYGDELFGQYGIAMAAFKLENPDKANDEEAAQLAGIESAVRSYEAILKLQPKATDSLMDQLLAKRADGSLAQFLAQNHCKESK